MKFFIDTANLEQIRKAHELEMCIRDSVNPTDMSLTDKDRIDVVQRVYGVLRRHRDLARYYTRKNISISLLRA